jgi:hypothetical protein
MGLKYECSSMWQMALWSVCWWATQRESKHKILILYEYYNNHHPTRLEIEIQIQMEE